MAEAGYADGFDMELMPTSTYQDTVRQAQVLQAQLAAIGIRTTINAPEWAEWLELEGNFRYDGYICSWNGLIDVEQYYYLQHRTDEVFNFTGYSDSAFDAFGRRKVAPSPTLTSATPSTSRPIRFWLTRRPTCTSTTRLSSAR